MRRENTGECKTTEEHGLNGLKKELFWLTFFRECSLKKYILKWRSKKSSREAIIIIPVQDDSGLDQRAKVEIMTKG